MATFKPGTLGVGDGIEDVVKLPAGENMNEWLSIHVVDFMNEVSLLYGIIAEYDTEDKYPVMSAGDFTYKWSDETTKKPVSVSAPKYVELLFDWIERQLNDEKIFPIDVENDFPKDFRKRVKHIFSRLFRVYAHIYCSHIKHIELQDAEVRNESFPRSRGGPSRLVSQPTDSQTETREFQLETFRSFRARVSTPSRTGVATCPKDP